MARRRLSDSVPENHELLDMTDEQPSDSSKSRAEKPKVESSSTFKIFVGFALFLLGIYLFSGPRHYKKVEEILDVCEKPVFGRPPRQYVLMLDAGSSGSRIHIYRFNYCKDTPEIEDEKFLAIEPGLSANIDDPEKAAESLDELMNLALEYVPEKLHSCTPVSIKATAGLRKYPKKGAAVLAAVGNRLKSKYPFKIIESRGVEIMEGIDEGVYAWITVNYLLGKLNSDASPFSSVATIDLGGGSVQLVFEPKFDLPKKMEDGEHKYNLNFANKDHVLYQKSYMGFGLNEAKSKINQLIADDWIKSHPDSNSEIEHPCITKGVKLELDGETDNIYNFIGTASNFEKCGDVIKNLFKKKDACPLSPCSFNGVYQPSLKETFGNSDIFVFSFFYDRTNTYGLKNQFMVKEIRTIAEHICQNDVNYFEGNNEALRELKDKPQRCMETSYLYTLLSTGFDVEDDRMLKSAKKIKELETGWCLGASIAVLDEKDYCPAH